MENKKPYDRSPPLRLKCVATRSRPLAKSFIFGEAVGAEWSSLNYCMLTDDTQAYYNDNTVCYKSYEMAVSPEILDQAAKLLLPPSKPVKAAEINTSASQYLTVEGQVISVGAIRQVRLKDVPIPILELYLQDADVELAVSLWREMALSTIVVGDWVRISHLRKPTNTAYGFKLNTSTFTTVTKIQSEVSTVEVTLIGAEVGETGAKVLMDTGLELQVPLTDWRGTEQEFLERLPLKLTLDIMGDFITSAHKLFEEVWEQGEAEDLGVDAEEGLEGLEDF
ncbi:uncharacterized protein LOC121677457 isoform X2 [Alosa sapidissima]|uniref:uncharacterized protein LOC121677457 isoform X2 n=1 Tax=Alosa sapidissima TaxID=34773 RepID=UPI001C082DC3|nr:uncharacterized protein LOC121677457 isoform X2 [Alosa sapidissima]